MKKFNLNQENLLMLFLMCEDKAFEHRYFKGVDEELLEKYPKLKLIKHVCNEHKLITQRPLMAALNQFEDYEIVEQFKQGQFKCYRLTKKGKEIAEKLIEE